MLHTLNVLHASQRYRCDGDEAIEYRMPHTFNVLHSSFIGAHPPANLMPVSDGVLGTWLTDGHQSIEAALNSC